MDHFSIENCSYLLTVDCFSGWLCIYHFKHHKSTANALANVGNSSLHLVSLKKSAKMKDPVYFNILPKFTSNAHLLFTHSQMASLKYLLKHQRELFEKTFPLMVR